MKNWPKETKRELAKYLLDVSKLLFAGVILTGIMKTEMVGKILLYAVATLSMIALAISGFALFNNINEKEEV
jgi:hypothetical protein